jgi:hypothetical protein
MWEAKGTYSSDLGPRAAALVALYPNRVLNESSHHSGHTMGWSSIIIGPHLGLRELLDKFVRPVQHCWTNSTGLTGRPNR